MRPQVHYARAWDGTHIAFHAIGDSALNVVYMPHWATNVEVMWESKHVARFCRRLAEFSRVILFDKRGVGLSDPVPLPHVPTLESWMEDVTAILDALSLDQAALVAGDAAGFIAALFAATHPERTSRLVLVNSTSRVRRADDYPVGLPDHVAEWFINTLTSTWGQNTPMAAAVAPVPGADRAEFITRYQRATASPGVLAPMLRLCVDADIRSILPSIRVPTLVLHRRDDQYLRVGHGRYLGEHIPGAHYVELPGSDHDPHFGDADSVLAEIQEFLTGERPTQPSDRLLATVVFTDMVESTPYAARVGDAQWLELLDRLDRAVERYSARFRGEVIKSTGDGHLVIFDAPGRAIQWAESLLDAARGLEVQLRVGIHTGEIDRRGSDVAGVAVHIASRVSKLSGPGQILVTNTVRDLVVGSGIKFSEVGSRELKGISGAWGLLSVTK
jgi:pimeloyl-ACP methyl ester carboxylesterase/class 3 adenylate cyclase